MRWSLLISCAAMGLLAASPGVRADDLDDLKAQLKALQDKTRPSAPQGERRPAPAAAVEAGSKPKSWKLPGTNTSMSIGGFMLLTFDYDLDGISNYAPGNAQVDGTRGGAASGQFQPRPPRVAHVHRDLDADRLGRSHYAHRVRRQRLGRHSGRTAAKTQYSCGQGAAIRLRKAYGQLGPVLAGQDTTTFNVPGNGERTDPVNPFLGSTIYRLGMVRYMHIWRRHPAPDRGRGPDRHQRKSPRSARAPSSRPAMARRPGRRA